MQAALTWPDNQPVYDVPSQAPFLFDPCTPCPCIDLAAVERSRLMESAETGMADRKRAEKVKSTSDSCKNPELGPSLFSLFVIAMPNEQGV